MNNIATDSENTAKITKYENLKNDERKLFNIKLSGSSVSNAEADSWGNIKISLNRTNDNDYKVNLNEKTNKNTDATLYVPKEKLLNIAKENNGNIKLIAFDKAPKFTHERFSKEDLVVIENSYKGTQEHLSTVAKVDFPKNIVGAGFTNNPTLLKLGYDDVSHDGLLNSIMKNDHVRTLAIISKDPTIVKEKHQYFLESEKKENVNIPSLVENALKKAIETNEKSPVYRFTEKFNNDASFREKYENTFNKQTGLSFEDEIIRSSTKNNIEAISKMSFTEFEKKLKENEPVINKLREEKNELQLKENTNPNNKLTIYGENVKFKGKDEKGDFKFANSETGKMYNFNSSEVMKNVKSYLPSGDSTNDVIFNNAIGNLGAKLNFTDKKIETGLKSENKNENLIESTKNTIKSFFKLK